MRVNFILPGIFRSGGVRIVFEYANRLSEKGHEVMVYYPLVPYSNKKSFYNYSKNIYGKIFELLKTNKSICNYGKINFKVKLIPKIDKIFLRKADVVIATAWQTAYSVADLKIDLSKKFYLIQDYENWNSNLKFVDNSYRLPLNKIVVSQYLNHLLKSKFNVDSKTILNGIDFNKFHLIENVRNSKNINILFIDHGLKRKNTKLAIDVSIKLKKIYPDINFTCFGSKKFNQFPNFIKFYLNPSDNKIRELYSRAHIFLFTSNEEGFGLPPAEAMACKCAVVSTRVGAIQEYAVDGKSILFSEVNDNEKYFNNIIKLIQNEEYRNEIAINGYIMVKKILNWEDSINSLIKFLRNPA